MQDGDAEKSGGLRGELVRITESCGVECVGIDLSDARAKAVRIYIDSPEGVGHPECERVSRAVSDYLDSCEGDGRPWFSGKYFVEVSSPGIERPLFTEDHYRRFAGCRVSVTTRSRQKIEGEIVSCDSGFVTLCALDGSMARLAFHDIKKGNLVYVLKKGEKKDPSTQKKRRNAGKT
jgi:ribosome maturation factor RimP